MHFEILFLSFWALMISNFTFGQGPGAQVSTIVTKYMTPVITAKGNRSFESHASNIEQVQFVASKAASGLAKHPNVTFAIQITRKSCKAMKLCFGNKTNLVRHLDLLSKVKLEEKGYNRKLSKAILDLAERGTYEVDACKGMTAIEWEFPKSWSWNNMSQDKGLIHYSAPYKAAQPSTYRTKMSGMSNVETIILHNDLLIKPPKLGLEIRHGPILFNIPMDVTTPAYTTFYETLDFWSASKEVYFVLAQDANDCGARITAPITTHTFLKREIILNFRPGIMYRIRRGVNIWSIPIGFIVGTIVGAFGGTFLLCQNTKTYYKRWNEEMKKTFGKFASGDVTTMTTVGGGVSQMTTAGVSQMTTAGVSQMTTGGDVSQQK